MALALEGMRILLVEDHDDSRETLTSYLRLFGATVKAVATAYAAIDACASFCPDVIVSDLELPGLDGWRMLQDLRQSGCRAPAVAVSAHSTENDRMRSGAAGYRSHLAKPVTPNQLLSEVQAAAAAA
jgi:CheY-like chemotaxis protein